MAVMGMMRPVVAKYPQWPFLVRVQRSGKQQKRMGSQLILVCKSSLT
jgi:hypothetical protein